MQLSALFLIVSAALASAAPAPEPADAAATMCGDCVDGHMWCTYNVPPGGSYIIDC